MKYSVKQLVPPEGLSFCITAANTGEALDLVAMMIERGAKEVEIIDANGRRYDLIDLESIFDEECAARPTGQGYIEHNAAQAGAALKRFRSRL
jgi:hypothetical protein